MATATQAAMDMPPEAANPYANPDTAAIYDQMRQSVSPKEFSDEVLAGASQVDPQEVAKFKAELDQLDVPMEVLDMLNNMVDEILANPDNYEQVKQKYEAMGVTEDLLPPQFDGEFFSALNMAVDQMIAEPAGEQAFAKGGIAELKPISKAVADYGRNGDTMLAHITPAEARMLRRKGGAGTTNPKTGLKEYFSLGKLFKSIGKAVKSFVNSTVGKIVTTVALGFFLGPAAASLVGATSAAGVAAVSGFVGSAGATLLGGGNLKDALKAGAVGGLTAGAGAGVMGGSEAFTSGSYAGPTTVAGQVDKFTNMISPSAAAPAPAATASGIQAPSISATGEVAGMAPVNPTEFATPEALNAQAPAASDFAPKKVTLDGGPVIQSQTPGGATVTHSSLLPPGTANPMDATQYPGSFDKTSIAPPTDTSYLDKAKAFYNENISPSGIQQQGMPAAEQAGKAAQDALLARTPTATPAMLENAYQTAYKNAMPGIVSTYGPMAAVGIGVLGAAGGFKPTAAAPSSLRPELMKPVTQRIAEGGNQRNFYIQGLPGVKYDQYGAPIFGQNMPLPTFETGLGITSLMNPRGYAEGGSIAVGYAGGGLTGVSDVANRAITANNFDETAYLKANPDVAAAIAKGEFANAYEHYSKYGQAEGRAAFDKAETAAAAAKDAEEKAAAQAANRKAVADAKAAKKAAGWGSAYQNINAGLSYDAPAGIAATSIAARQAAFKPTMDKFTQSQTANAATLAKPYTPTIVDQPYNNTKGYENVFNPAVTPVNYDTTPVGTTLPPVDTGYTGRAINDQEVVDWLKANPNATDREIVKVMDYYKVNPEQVARVTGMQGVDPTSVQNIDRRYNMAKLANEGTNAFAVARQNQADAVTGQSIRDYFAKNPGMTDRQIADYMDQNSIDPAQMQYAFAGTPGAIGSHDVLARYQAATKLPAMVAGSPLEQALIADGQALLNRTIAAKQTPAAGGGQTFIPDPRLPEGMMGTMGGTGYDPVTGRVDLGTAGGSGQYVPVAETPKKLLNMGGIASLGSGGYPRRTGQISGPGTETSDSIPAMLSDGEFVMTAKAVRGAGKGDRRAGAKRMYALMNQLEKNAARG